ncbi:MAG: nickel-responsive transcriptional regulator NikR [Candidatus Methanomethylophilaceae archaeon]
MDGVSRIGVSLEPELLKQFDESISKKGYVSRSEAIRDLVRDSLAENEWKDPEAYMTGIVVIVYNSKVVDVVERMNSVYSKNNDLIKFKVDVTLDDTNVMETVFVNGKLGELKVFSTDITAVRGVLRGKLTMVSPSKGNMHHVGMRN